MLVVYALLIIAAGYGCSAVRIDFSVEYFIGSDAYIYDFFQLNDKYFKTGFSTTLFVDNPEIDYTSPETQFQLLEFDDKLLRCYACKEPWFKENTLASWYSKFN